MKKSTSTEKKLLIMKNLSRSSSQSIQLMILILFQLITLLKRANPQIKTLGNSCKFKLASRIPFAMLRLWRGGQTKPRSSPNSQTASSTNSQAHLDVGNT